MADVTREIIDAIRLNNNNTLVNLLYKKILPGVERSVVKNGGTKKDAEDVFQDAVIVLMRTVKMGNNSIDNVEAFVKAIAYRLWVNKFKRGLHEQKLDDLPETGIDELITTHIFLEERKNRILHIISRLGNTCFEILKSIMFDEKEYDDIAVEQNFANGMVVKTYKNRCKNKFLELLEKDSALKKEINEYARQNRRHIKLD